MMKGKLAAFRPTQLMSIMTMSSSGLTASGRRVLAVTEMLSVTTRPWESYTATCVGRLFPAGAVVPPKRLKPPSVRYL